MWTSRAVKAGDELFLSYGRLYDRSYMTSNQQNWMRRSQETNNTRYILPRSAGEKRRAPRMIYQEDPHQYLVEGGRPTDYSVGKRKRMSSAEARQLEGLRRWAADAYSHDLLSAIKRPRSNRVREDHRRVPSRFGSMQDIRRRSRPMSM